MLGEGAIITAIHSTTPTSLGQTQPDASVDMGSDIGEDRQPIVNEPCSSDESMGKVSSPTVKRVEDQMPHMIASITLPETQALEQSSSDDRKLVL